ncbi:MAG: hypothetical protein M0Z50_02150 [Planctomycetia bacterium]|nr:hypothetical protein [Planctomycetia bacterium]
MHTKPLTNDHSESGAALLVVVLVSALLMLLIAESVAMMGRTSVQSASDVGQSNEARAAALAGVSAMTQYAQNIHSTADTASSNDSNCEQDMLGLGPLLCGLDTNLPGGQVAIPNGGNGGVAVEMPVGTTATATISNASPYVDARVRAVVTANTFSPASGATPSKPGIISILSEGQSGSASATVAAVLGAVAATPSATSSSSVINNAININGNSTFSGDVNVVGGDAPQNLSDNGSVSTGGSFNGFNSIYSVDSLTISGSSTNPNESIFSDQSITLSGSGQYASVKALGNVSTSGGVNSAYIQANGSVSISSGGATTVLSGTGTAGSGGVTMTGHANVGSVTTTGNVSQDSGTVTSLHTDGNYSASSWPTVGSGIVGGSISGSGNFQGLVSQPGYQVSITPLTQVTVSQPTINVYPLAQDANFAFYPPTSTESANGVVADVVVDHVNGFTSGATYYLYNETVGGSPYYGYLCTADTGYNGNCTNIAQGFSAYNAEITYSNGTWTLDGISVAPGVLFFSGNLSVGSGTYNDSLLATGDETLSSASPAVQAPNYAGPDLACSYKNVNGAYVYPTNFCTTGPYSGAGAYSGYVAASIGNIALYTGGTDASGTFTGGNLSLGASNNIGGDIIAANTINTGGSTTINGYLLVGGENPGSGTGNSFGDSTTIGLSNLPATFTPILPSSPGGYSATAPYAPPPPETVMKLLDIYWLN